MAAPAQIKERLLLKDTLYFNFGADEWVKLGHPSAKTPIPNLDY